MNENKSTGVAYLFTSPDLVNWEQVARIADQCTYIAKENGRNAWVGIYGTRDTGAEDVERISSDLENLLAQRRVGIRTSVYGKLRLSELRQQEQPQHSIAGKGIQVVNISLDRLPDTVESPHFSAVQP